jgi:tetratricopeptide (TPR) repeat protein
MYTVREVATVLGVRPSRLRAYLRSGLIAPRRGERGELRFSFQDLVLLRRAEGLVERRIPPRRVHDALRRLREELGQDAPLLHVQLSAEGRSVVVSDGQQRWEPASGQVVFDFKRASAETGALHELPRKPPGKPVGSPAPDAAATPPARVFTAEEHYERGYAAEEAGDPKTAMAEYRRAIALDPRLSDAQVNLGRLLHEAGQAEEALASYRAALAVRRDDPIAAFNLGVALEDLGRRAEAIEAYCRAIAISPDSADAHYNVARLYEQTGASESAIRHLLIYRRLTRKRK